MQLHITQHKRFVSYDIHPNPALIFGGAGWVGVNKGQTPILPDASHKNVL